MYISGRFDIIHDEDSFNETIADMETLIDYFDIKEFIMCYEEKTKLGLPTKPHTHFFLNISEDYNIKQVRYFITENLGYRGTHSSLKTIPEDNKELALIYIAKQQQVMISSYDSQQINNILQQSKEHNNKIELSNNELYEKIIQNIKHKKLWKREDYIREIFDVFYDFPKQKKPNGLSLLTFIQRIEQETLVKELAFSRYFSDNSLYNTKITEEWLYKFENSE